MKKGMQRLLLVLVIVTIFGSFLTGCSKKEEVKDPNEILIWVNGTNDQITKFKEVAAVWSEKNGGVPVKILQEADNANKYIEYSIIRPDIYWGVSASDTEKLQVAKSVAEVPKDVFKPEEFISKDLIDAVSINQIQYGIPVYQDTVALFYNKDVVNTVPDTMEELVEEAKTKGFTTEIDNKTFNYGFVAAYGGYLIKNNDGVFDDKDIGASNEGSIKGYKFIQDLVKKDNLLISGTTDMMAEYAFSSGKAGYYIGESGRVRTFKAENVNFGVTKIPTLNGQEVKPLKSVNMAVVNSESDKKDLAWSLLRYLTDSTSEYIMATNPKAPVLKASLNTETYKNNDYLHALYEQSLQATLMPNTITGIAYKTAIDGSLSSLTLGLMTPEECGAQIEKDINEAIENARVK